MAAADTPGSDDPLTDPLAATLASTGSDSIESRRLRAGVKEALFGGATPVRIGRYRLDAKLGEGGMGVVYRARDEHLDRDVAIKVLRPDGGGTPRRLLREARSMARLSHPNIAAVFDVGAHESSVYVAMELVEGASLREWLQTPRRFADIRDVFVQAGQGLAAAHEAGVVHRDFKPDNVLVGRDGRVRVLDFGLAKLRAPGLAESSDAPLTATGGVLGTPRYMAPEQLRQREAGPAADQFAFSVALYEAAYGQLPFEGEVFADLAVSVLSGAPRTPPADVGAPAELWPVLQRGLAREPGDRYASMAALCEAVAGVNAGGAMAPIVSRPALRDAREKARSMLANAFADSLLDADELDDRLERLEHAGDEGAVGSLVADLQPKPVPAPAPVPAVRTERVPDLPANVDAPVRVTAIFGSTKRAGAWRVGRTNTLKAIFGGVDLDFRNVELPPGVTELRLQVFCGGVDIVVPPGVRIEIETTAVLGGVDQQEAIEPLPPDAPVLRLTGYVLLGGVDIHERLHGEGTIGAWLRRRAAQKKQRKQLRAAQRARKQLPPGD